MTNPKQTPRRRPPSALGVIRIVIAEDHAIVREAVSNLLQRHPGIEIVGETASIRATLPILESQRPDILLADLSLEDGSAVQLVRTLRRQRIKVRILIMTGFNDDISLREVQEAGVAGLLLKEQPTEDLFTAIETVAAGGTYVSPILGDCLSKDRLASERKEPLASLSHREREVFRLIATGFDSRQIAVRLFISLKTVDSHRMSINRKLGVRTTAALVRFAHAHGITVGPRGQQADIKLRQPAG